ncbi:MAG TPA: GPP34 family phosphoprotein, partial [Pseudonocardiaceae bacterium]
MTELPPTLAAQLFLLTYDRDRERFTGRGHIGYVLRGAALAELHLRGHLADEDGRPVVTARADRPADPVLAGLLDEIARSRPRTWKHWIGRRGSRTRRAVLDGLVEGRWVDRHPRRLFGIVPFDRIVLLRRPAHTRLRDQIAAALRESTPA